MAPINFRVKPLTKSSWSNGIDVIQRPELLTGCCGYGPEPEPEPIEPPDFCVGTPRE